MIHFEGSESYPGPPELVAPKLSDAGWLARSLSDAEVTSAEPDRAAWKIRPKLAFVSGSLETTAEVLEREPGAGVRYRIIGKGVGSSSTVEASLKFRATEAGTAVDWTGDITALTGLLKMVPRGLIQAAAQKVIDEVLAAVRTRLQA